MTQRYMSAKEVAAQLQIAKSTAYAVIREWNKELEEQGYFTKAGSIPTAYFHKKCYGFQLEQ
ncbi:MAG: DNA-binding protein [Lachnospiraceae bacterium]|nr:DNA-binding protein [Lachnospiraceae bacterium]